MSRQLLLFSVVLDTGINDNILKYIVQRQTAITAQLISKQLLRFAFAVDTNINVTILKPNHDCVCITVTPYT